jgi:hypothetical protein
MFDAALSRLGAIVSALSRPFSAHALAAGADACVQTNPVANNAW